MHVRPVTLIAITLLAMSGTAEVADYDSTRLSPHITFGQAMQRGMQRMMQDMHAVGMTGDADIDFLAMMIPHHEGAVEMAQLVLVHGDDPLVRRLAEEIIASQQAEIQAMRARLRILRTKGEDPDPGGFPALHGTRGGAREPPR